MGITAASVLASLLITTLATWTARSNVDALTLAIATLVPTIVAPLISHFMVGLLHDVENTRALLHEAAIRDGLTHAYNRRFFMARLEVEGERAVRQAQPLSVLMIDVDHFKAINDAHGHAAGDRVLAALANSLISTMRPYDLVARYGGEEFVALLPGVDLAQALQIAERVRVAIESMRVEARGPEPLTVTASIGVSSLRSSDASATVTLDRADQAMYRAKHGGRNRCVSSD